MSETIAFDFFDPAFRENPHPVLARLRALDPVHRSRVGWIVTRHDDVERLNRDPRCGRDMSKVRGGGPIQRFAGNDGLLEFGRTAMLHRDAPDHTRIRKLMSYAFTPSAIQSMKAAVEEVAGRLIDALPAEGPIELIRDLAKPLPVAIICDIIGVPSQDFPLVQRWSYAMAETVEVTATPEQLRAAEQAFHEFTGYLAELVARHRHEMTSGRAEARNTLVGRLIAAEAETEALSARELVINIMLLLVGGHETTTNLIGNGMHALLEHPEELALLRQQPELLDTAVEELLRYESPANTNARVALEDFELRGKQIRAGDFILCMLGAANRDPAAFEDPDRLDIRRDPNPHQSFGGGPHFCIGAHLSRLEGRVAIRRLLERYPKIELDRTRTRWSHRINLRGLSQLGLVVRAR